MDEDFLLQNEPAKKLYHDFSEKMPILDYHCHISPREIAEDRHFETITQVWLGGDHYKWRLMRSFGIDEKYITGNASDEEKFVTFAKCLEKAVKSKRIAKNLECEIPEEVMKMLFEEIESGEDDHE